MPTAELIAIGTELLLGEIQDTNSRYLARALRDLGVDIYRATMIGDNTERIAQVIREAMQRSQIVITTGGLGPTVDDPTRAAVARALDVEIEFRPELWEQIQTRFSNYGRVPSDNNRRQAWIPQGAIPVVNPVGTAPSFICETVNSCIISLPGVPREMEYLTQNVVIPYLRDRFQLTGTIKAKVLHVAGVGESTIDDWIGNLMISINPTVGLLAHPGQVDIRITAKANSISEADQLINQMEAKVRMLVKEGLYGTDQESLEETVVHALQDKGWHSVLVESGTEGMLRAKMDLAHYPSHYINSLSNPCTQDELCQIVEQLRTQTKSEIGLGISLQPGSQKQTLLLYISTPRGQEIVTRSYGGERALSNQWSINTGLEMLRRKIIEL